MMLVRPLTTNLKMTVRDDCAVFSCNSPPPPPPHHTHTHTHTHTDSVYNTLTPCLSGEKGVSLWTDVHHPPPQLSASEMKQTSVSTNLACLLTFEQRAAGPHPAPHRPRRPFGHNGYNFCSTDVSTMISTNC